MIDNNVGKLTVELKAGSGGALQSKTASASNIEQVIRADGDYYGLKQVTIAPALLQSKNVSATDTEQTITADDNYYGLKQVTIGATTPAILEQISVKSGTIEQIMTPTPPANGFDKVTVEAINANQVVITPTTSEQIVTPADKSLDYFSSVRVDAVKIDGEETILPTKSTQVVTPSEGSLGIAKVTVDAIPQKYRDTSDATATAENIAKGYTAYVNGGKVTGTGTLAEMDAVEILSNTIEVIKSAQEISFNKNVCNSLTRIKVIDMPNMRLTGTVFYFANATALKKIRCLGVEGFDVSIWSLDELYLTNPETITTNLKINLYYLTTLVLAGKSIVTLSDASYISDSVNIYVNDNLIDKYKAATNWSAHADQIKPISEYGGWSDNA